MNLRIWLSWQVVIICCAAAVSAKTLADDGDAARQSLWINPNGVEDATLVIADELAPDALREFTELAGKKNRRIAKIDSHSFVSYNLPFQCCRGPLNDDLRRDLSRRLSSTSFFAVIDDGTALAIVGRNMQVLGRGSVTIVLAASPGRPLGEINLPSGSRSDLTMLRRAGRERSRGDFPSMVPALPLVPSGSLLIHGGGEVPGEVLQKFIDLAGGADAPIVVLPIAAADELSEDTSRETRLFTRVAATNVKSLRARSRDEMDSPEFVQALKDAKGVWFSGGRQWRFVDAYLGTRAQTLFRDVLARGGVIGGSSAGASIQGEYMPRGSPLGNTEMMAEGYERGLGFLAGVAIDQHFSQRGRHADMTSLMRRYPQFLGIGLDEGTAIIVQQSTAKIMGRGRVHFYDYRCGEPPGETDYVAGKAGQAYDLPARKLIGVD